MFKIKKQWQFEYGAQHYLDQISLLNLFPIKVRNVVWPVLKRNSYWAHSENVIITLLAHENGNKRKFAIDLINKIRCKKENVLRQFKLPLIKESDKRLEDFLPEVKLCYEPPLTKSLTEDELNNYLQNPLQSRIPCHFQGVERCVKMVTEASCHVYGGEARDGYIGAQIKSRHMVSKFSTKSDFIL